MTNSEKAFIYDECTREGDVLYREISKLKSEYAGNPPDNIVEIIRKKEARIQELNNRLNSYFWIKVL